MVGLCVCGGGGASVFSENVVVFQNASTRLKFLTTRSFWYPGLSQSLRKKFQITQFQRKRILKFFTTYVAILIKCLIFYSPALKKWGLYWICLVLPEFCGSVILS